MGRTKWPATYTWYFVLGMQLSPALQSLFSFHLGCSYAQKKKDKPKNFVLSADYYSNDLTTFKLPLLPLIEALHQSHCLCFRNMFLTIIYSPRWRKVVWTIGSSENFLFPPNMTTILKFGPDPNTVAVWPHRGPISCARVTCTGGGNSNWWNIHYITYCVSVYTSTVSTLEHTLFRYANYV